MIIVGLGNPGKKFENTRHNVGFMAVDKIASEFSAQGGPASGWKLDKKSNALLSENENVILVKPQTFMNDSGNAVKEIIKNKNVENIVVIHDDVDLPVGKIKIVQERGSAGHKGVESIIQSIGNEGLVRMRIGIQPSKDTKAIKIVLKNFSKSEQELIDQAVKKTSQAINSLIINGLNKTMSEFNA
jgi:PTH1 family peptidyl-tRNA hydrolase